MKPMLSALGLVMLLASCKVNVDYSGTEYQCPDGVTCPPGYTCENMVCVSGDFDAGSADAGVGNDGSVASACGHASAIAEDFSGTVRWANLQSTDGADVEVSGGRAVLTLPSSPTGSPSANLVSHMRFDLRGDSVSLELPQMVNTATAASAEVVLTVTWRDYVEFFQEAGVLSFKSWVGGSLETDIQLAYSPTAHRWWRFRESEGTLYWETSPDGADWTTQHSIVTPSYVSRSNLWISAYTSSGQVASGALHVDNLNTGGVSGQWCPMTDFADDFEDNDPGSDWTTWDNDCTAGMQAGRFRFAPEADLAGDCGASLATAWDMTGGSAHIEIPSVAGATDTTTFFNMTDYNGNRASFNIQNGGIGFWLCNPSCTQTSTSYSATEHRWLRLRDESGDIVFETSPDASVWTERARQAALFGLEQVSITIGVTAPTASSSPGVSLFDNYNLTP